MTRVPASARLWLLGTVLLAACAPAPSALPEPVATRPPTNMPAAWPLFASLKADTGASGMVVSGSPLASQVGAAILRQGGSAVDAAVAVGFALAVVHPEAGNIGGGGFMVIRFADGRTNALDYRETAPGQASRDMYLDAQGRLTDQSLTGHLAAGVPGSVAGLAEAHRRYGKLTWTQVVAPAIRLARDGFVVDEFRSRSIGGSADRLRRFAASRAQFLPGGNPPGPGTTLKQPDLAVTLQAIADSGPRAFYQGRTADLMVEEMDRGNGIITKADLAAYRPVWRDPIVIKYRGHTIYSMPPSSSGGVTMAEALNVLEGYDPLPEFGVAATGPECTQRGIAGERAQRRDAPLVDAAQPVHLPSKASKPAPSPIPKAKAPNYHQDLASMVENSGTLAITDGAGWAYVNAPGDSNFGTVWVNCTHTDTKGSIWTSY
ncbi:MAG: gamma-glutamyltransferase [Gemmatimonadetes bacterium]|nr:gamma-glutamyltransferase [Gemmatimonadota bacterium]